MINIKKVRNEILNSIEKPENVLERAINTRLNQVLCSYSVELEESLNALEREVEICTFKNIKKILRRYCHGTH